MLDLKPKPANGSQLHRATVPAAPDRRQPRRLVLALVLLLVTFGALIVKERDFWFGPSSDDNELAGATQPEATQPATAKAAPVAAPTSSALPATHAVAKEAATPAPAQNAPAISATRTVLPPLDVEVVAGESHRNVHPGSNALSVEIIKSGTSTPRLAAATSAADREFISTGAGTYTANYPLLAQQMRVQGSVVLQAFIGADGIIQNLRVISGPGILTSAAERAVRAWHFKPVLQNGQPVETKATITVNFTINVGDSSANLS